jgi:PhzF family phenazine biosynthesis protein
MRSLAMYQVDAFADHVFGGNPAAVLVLDDWLTDDTMQNIAAENNLAETAFVRANAAGWDLRWFTPLHEVDFCGHATLATAHVLATERRIEGELVFATRVGELRVSRQEDGYTLDVPSLPPTPVDDLPSALSPMFPNAGATLFRNFENIFVELSGEQPCASLCPTSRRSLPFIRSDWP